MSTTGQYHAMPPLTYVPVTELAEQIRDASRVAGRMFLDAYEKTLESIVGYQEQAASQANVDWIAAATRAQARITRQLGEAHVSMGRELLK